MDFWVVILLVVFLCGIMGWTSSIFFNAVWWYCDWREGTAINWGWDVGLSLAVPFIWVYSLLLVFVLYCG